MNHAAQKGETATTVKPKEKDEVAVPIPPDGGYGWVIVIASFICNMVVDGVSYCFGIFKDDLMEYYGESSGKVAWVGSILTGVTMCSGPLVSAFANRYGCRLCCIAGALISAAAFGLSVLCPSVEMLMIVYGVVGGIGFGLMYLPAVVCVGYYFESRRSLATGIAVCGSGFGTVVFAPLGTYLLHYGWKSAHLWLAGVCLACVVFGALMKPIEYAGEEKTLKSYKVQGSHITLHSNGEVAKAHTSLVDIATSRVSISSTRSKTSNVLPPLARKDVFYGGSVTNLKEFQSQKSLHNYRQSVLSIPQLNSKKSQLLDMDLLKDPVFLAIALVNLFSFIGLYIPFVYIGDRAKEDGFDDDAASFLISIMGITNTVGRIVCGFIADFPKVNTMWVHNICLVVMTASVAAIPICHSYAAYISVATVYGTSMAGFISLCSILLVDYLGLDKLTSAFGFTLLFRGTGAFIGSPLAGMLFDATKSYTVSFLAGSAFFGIASVITFLVPVLHRRKAKTVTDEEAMTPMNAKKEEEE
nr:monocarboxylate transporter 7-like isoform X1 [Leptinotarsa decemlineata]